MIFLCVRHLQGTNIAWKKGPEEVPWSRLSQASREEALKN